MNVYSYLHVIPDMQSVEIIQKGKTQFDGFAYELYGNNLENAVVIRMIAEGNVLKLEVY